MRDPTSVTTTHMVSAMSTHEPIGGLPGRMPRNGTTANSIAAIQLSMSVCTLRRRRAVCTATNAASAASVAIISSRIAEYTRVPTPLARYTAAPIPLDAYSSSTDTDSARTVHPSTLSARRTRLRWISTAPPATVYASATMGVTSNRSSGHRPARPRAIS
ncbi:hypothetical protein RHDE110596_09475 [Prescottella defluvii]